MNPFWILEINNGYDYDVLNETRSIRCKIPVKRAVKSIETRRIGHNPD
jgi:hypothetical protein